MRPGKFDRVIEIWRRNESHQGSMGRVEGGFSLLITRSAMLIRSRGREVVESEGRKAVAPATFIVRFDPETKSINAKDRVKFEGRDYDIFSANELKRGRSIEIVAIAAADDAPIGET